MSEWPRVCLCELPLSIVDGDRGKNYPKHDEFLKDGFCLFLSTTNVTRDGLQFGAFNQYITREKDSKLRKGKLQRGDIILTTRGTLGNVGYYSNDVPYDNVRINSGMVILRPDGELIDGEFVYSYLRSDDFMAQVQARHSGAAQPQLPIKDLCSLSMPLPPLPVQHRIAAILSDYDSAIANARKQIELLEEAAMRLYREWFVEKDYECEKGKISNWFDVTIGRTPSRKVTDNFSTDISDVKWCSIADIKNTSTFIYDTAEKLTSKGVDSSKIRISPPGSIFLSFKLTVGRVAITSDWMSSNEAIAHFETNDRKFRDYTYCYLRDFKYSTLGSTSSIGTAINSEIVKGMPFIMPSSKVLDAFSMQAKPIFDTIEDKGLLIRKLTEARDRLLPKLMSGEVAI